MNGIEAIEDIFVHKQQIVICLSGISGSGKSELARYISEISDTLDIVSADHFFNLGNGYRFNFRNLSLAHAFCRNRFLDSLDSGNSVIIDNTNTSAFENEFYREEAYRRRIPFYFVFRNASIDDAEHRCIHKVPLKTLKAQEARLVVFKNDVISDKIAHVSEYFIIEETDAPVPIKKSEMEVAMIICSILHYTYNYPVWIVGGWATEIGKIYLEEEMKLLRKKAITHCSPNDVDLATYAPRELIEKIFSAYSTNSRFNGMLSISVCDGKKVINITSGEGMGKSTDFAINSIRWNPFQGDPFIPESNQKWDIAEVLREPVTLNVHSPTSFEDDPHRALLRMIRLSANKGYKIPKREWYDAKVIMDRLLMKLPIHIPFLGVSPERVFEETTKILTGGAAGYGFRLIAGLGALQSPEDCFGIADDILMEYNLKHPSLFELYFPDLVPMISCQQPEKFHKEGSVWQHTLLMLDHLEKGCDPALAWAVLLHDSGKPSTQGHDKKNEPDRITFYGHQDQSAQIARKILGHGENGLRASSDFVDEVAWLCENHMLMHNWVNKMKPGTRKKLASSIPRFGKLIELSRLDSIGSMNEPPFEDVDAALEYLSTTRYMDNNPERLVVGNDLLEIIQEKKLYTIQGKQLGEVLAWVYARQLDGLYDSGGRDQALSHARGRITQVHQLNLKR